MFKLKVKGLDFVRAADASSTLSGLRRKMDGIVTRCEGVCLAPSLRPEGKRVVALGVGGRTSHSGAVEVEAFCKEHRYADAIYRGAIVSTSDGALQPDGWFSRSHKPASQNEGNNETKGYVTHGFLPVKRVLGLIPTARQANVNPMEWRTQAVASSGVRTSPTARARTARLAAARSSLGGG